jgi:hypothetical protein
MLERCIVDKWWKTGIISVKLRFIFKILIQVNCVSDSSSVILMKRIWVLYSEPIISSVSVAIRKQKTISWRSVGMFPEVLLGTVWHFQMQ